MNQSQQVLGYQLRVPFSQLLALWPASRREEYLLLPTVESPLSADLSVWPAVKKDPVLSKLFEDYTGGKFEAPNGLNVFRLRPDFRPALDALRDDQGRLVALSARQDAAQALITRHAIVDPGGQSAMVASHSLGYDVCDQTFVSVLMNCGVAAAERTKLRAAFANALNKHGLFDAMAQAEAFAARMVQVVPEHAPLVVVQLKAVGWS